jgi:hypothetical protein
MKRLWDSIFGLNYERSIWVEEEDLGKEKALYHKNKRYFVKIPQEINKEITLRLRGLGKTRGNKTGDLFLHVWLNKGEDVRKNLWLSETSARNGADKKLLLDGKLMTMVIPPKSYNGLTIRLKGLGRKSSFSQHAPVLDKKKRGNLLVKLFVYPDNITPNYGSFENLSTENMALEGWVYRKFDEVDHKLGRSSFPVHPIQASTIADLFNEWEWIRIFHALVDHLKLSHLAIELMTSASISQAGSCERTAAVQNNTVVGYHYRITINEQFLDNPFSIAAILAHELCHVVNYEKIDDTPKSVGYVTKTEKATLEEERMVDLLVFMFKMGEFQLRVARDKRLTLGYFNQEVFERIQIIVSKKLNSF